MVQVPKPHVREAFVAVAAATFAELGYEATTMAVVAERAGSSVGNLYKYFAGKQQLFAAAVPAELVEELTRRTLARMRALGNAKDVRELGHGAEYHALAGDLLDYCLAHRSAVVVVLSRAEGTAFASFAQGFVEKMVSFALEYARVTYPRLEQTAELRFVMQHAYRNFLASVSDALRKFPDEARARSVIGLLTAQHLGGLKSLFETEGEADAQSPNATQPPLVSQAARARARGSRASDANPSPTQPRAGQADRARRPRGRG